MKYFLSTILVAQLLAIPALAKSVKVVAHDRVIDLALPDGMCNVTHTDVGKNLLAFLSEANSADIRLPNPHVIFQSCETSKAIDQTGVSYPWGYIGLPQFIDPLLADVTQTDLNEAMQTDAMADFLTEYLDTIDKDFDETRQAWNLDAEIDASEGYTSLVANDDIFIGYMKLTGVAEEEPFVEHTLFTATILNGILLNYYIYEGENASNQLPMHIETLKDAAAFNVTEGI